MAALRIPLLIHGDEELASIAAALDIPPPQDPISFAPPWRFSLPHVCVASFGALLFGYHSGVLNAALQFIARDLNFADNTLAQGWVVSVCIVGAMFGCFFSGALADELGRRRGLQLSTLPTIVGASLSAVAPNFSIMIVGRFLVGVGVGIGAPVSTLYVSEISPAAFRGTFGALFQIAACLGLLGALVAGLPVAVIAGWWRVCFWLSTIPAVMLALGLEFCSESPRWLFKKSRWLEAEVAIKRLWGVSNLKAAANELVRGESGNTVEQASYAELFSKIYVKTVLTGAGIFILQQFSGISAVFYFSSTFFQKAGVTSSLMASVYVGIVNLFASCLAAFLMDRVGRKTLLMGSFFGMFLGMGIQTTAVTTPTLLHGHSYLLLIGTLFYVFMFAIGVGPVPLALLPEMFPSRIRAKAMAVSMGMHWMSNFLLGLLYLPVIDKFGAPYVYLSFTIVCLLGVVFVRENVVETNGRSLEDIEASLFNDDV